jgi:hypothetical protein
MDTHHVARVKRVHFAAMKRIAEWLVDENSRYAPFVSLALGIAWALIATLLVTSVFAVD